MPDLPPPCCHVGRRSDVNDINAAFAAGDSVGQVMAAFKGLSRGSIGRHRSKCLAVGNIPGNDPGTDAGTGTVRPRQQPPVRRASNESTAGTHSRNAGNVVPLRRTVKLTDAYGITAPEEQTTFIARLIEGHAFFFRSTLEWLASAWRLESNEVRERYRLAVQRISVDKQVECAEKEVNLAALETQEAAAWREFKRLRVSEPTTAKGYLQLALKARTEYADLAGLRRSKVDVNVNIWTQPEFVMAVDAVVESSLDACIPRADADFMAMVREAEEKLGVKIDPAVAAAILEIASGRVEAKLQAQVRAGSGASEPVAAE